MTVEKLQPMQGKKQQNRGSLGGPYACIINNQEKMHRFLVKRREKRKIYEQCLDTTHNHKTQITTWEDLD